MEELKKNTHRDWHLWVLQMNSKTPNKVHQSITNPINVQLIASLLSINFREPRITRNSRKGSKSIYSFLKKTNKHKK